MNYIAKIQSLKDDERKSNPDAKFLISKVFAECCNNWVGRTRVFSFATKQQALDHAADLIGDYDLSTTEWYKDEFAEVEYGDPAMAAAIAELAEYHRITVGDFRIEIDDLEN
jgi:hypothetical protein